MTPARRKRLPLQSGCTEMAGEDRDSQGETIKQVWLFGKETCGSLLTVPLIIRTENPVNLRQKVPFGSQVHGPSLRVATPPGK